MANKNKPESAAAAAGAQRTSYSVAEFCAMNSLSESTYLTLRKRGLAPRETRVLRRVLIMVEDANAWRAERRAESAKNAASAADA